MEFFQRALLVFLIASFCLPGCASAPLPSIPTVTPFPATSTPTPAPTFTLTPLPSQTQIPIVTETRWLSLVETPTPTPNPVRRTPPTLMLHRRNYKFDSVQFLREFIPILKASEMEVVTYWKLTKKPDLSLVKQGKLVIITIDDLYLRYPIDPSVLEMIDLLTEAGYPAVLGVVTESEYAYPETVATLRALQAKGWEIASHSDTHRNLAAVEEIAPRSIYPEIKASLDKLEKSFDLRPVTLILPEGQMTWTDEQIIRSGVLWVIGINGGVEYDTRRSYYYLGRESPAGNAQTTFANMLKRFNP